jgi:hypothetical protein
MSSFVNPDCGHPIMLALNDNISQGDDNELVIVVSSILNNRFVSKQLSQLKLSKQVKYKSQLV